MIDNPDDQFLDGVPQYYFLCEVLCGVFPEAHAVDLRVPQHERRVGSSARVCNRAGIVEQNVPSLLVSKPLCSVSAGVYVCWCAYVGRPAPLPRF